MRVVCLNPPFKTEHGRFSRTSRSPAITKSGTIYYPIWLAYVCGIIEKEGFDVKLIDSPAYEYSFEKTLKIVREFNPGLVIIDTSTPSIYEDLKCGDALKSLLPDAFVVLMGTHPTALPEETLSLSKAVDAVIVGEADYTAKDLAEAVKNSDRKRLFADSEYRKSVLRKIDGLFFRLKDGFVMNNSRALIENLDELPFVSEVYAKHLDVRKYFFAASDWPEVQIMASRGCIAKCTFCVYPQTIHKGKYRMRSAKNIADEFEWVRENLPEVREIGVEDDVFTGSKRRVLEFCDEIVARKLKMKWYCNVRVDLDFETMRAMKRAGCVLVTVGYESANDKVLSNIRKRITSEDILRFSRDTRRAGLMVHGCFMAGNRGETKETLEESLRLALKMTDDTMQFFPLMVYPGTEDYEWAKENNLLTIRDYSDYNTYEGEHNSVIRMPDMTSGEIRRWCDYARKKYYLRPRYIFYKLIQQITRPSEIRRTYKAFKRFVKFLIRR